jgi:hypothetical protein
VLVPDELATRSAWLKDGNNPGWVNVHICSPLILTCSSLAERSQEAPGANESCERATEGEHSTTMQAAVASLLTYIIAYVSGIEPQTGQYD